MERVRCRIVRERLALADCREGDEVDIACTPKGGRRDIGRVHLRRAKRLADGSLQIKVRGTSSTDLVRKFVVPGDLVVERIRPADERDAETKVTTECELVEHEVVTYAETDPDADVARIKAPLALAQATAEARPDNDARFMRGGRLMGPLDVLGMEGGILEVGAAIARARSRHLK